MMARVKALWARVRGRYWRALTIDVLIILAAFWAVHAWNTRKLPGPGEAPALSLAVLDGPAGRHALPSAGRGVVYFFAPWCFYCRHSIGHLDTLVQDGDIDWARAVALDFQDLAELRSFVAETGLRQPVLLGDASVAREWQIRAYPTYFVIGSDGGISARSVGYATRLGLEVRARMAP